MSKPTPEMKQKYNRRYYKKHRARLLAAANAKYRSRNK